MKKIVLAGVVIAALSACGGKGSATHIPDSPPLDSTASPRLAATLMAIPATSVLRQDSAKQTANRRMYACFDTADRLTDFGQHPAP